MSRPPWNQTVAQWVGMRDASDPIATAPSRVRSARNVLPIDTTLGTAWDGRPGCRLLGPRVSTGRVQWLGQFARATVDGSVVQHSLAVVGGLVYEFGWGSNTWTLRALGGGLVLDPVAMVSAVTFANRLILSDGVHKPIAWDGAAFAELSAAPVCYGPLTVYYAKLFGIMKADRRTLAWSNEADPFAGYITDQQWTLAQSDANALTAIRGTNEALYVWRARSITAIGGAVDDEFRSSGTRDGVSETVGTTSPFAVIGDDNQFYFLSADARPHVLTPGGGVRDVWAEVRETVAAVPRAFLSSALGVRNEALGVAQFHVRELGQTETSLGLWFDCTTEEPVSLCSGFSATAFGELLDTDGRAIVCHGSATGHVYAHDAAAPATDDNLAALDGGVRPIAHAVTLPPMGLAVAAEKKFDRIDIVMRSPGALSAVSVSVETPNGESSISDDVRVVGGEARFDVSVFDSARFAKQRAEIKLSLGISDSGRWCAPTIRHEALGETFGLAAVRLSGYLLTDPPKVR